MRIHKKLYSNILRIATSGIFYIAAMWCTTASAALVPDSVLLEPADSLQTDTLAALADSVPKRLAKPSTKGALDAKVDYTAQDSIVLLGNGTAFLHGKGDISYKDINLKAALVRVNMDSSMVYACGVPDSVGDIQDLPLFSESGQEYQSNELTYNLKTKKGYIKHAVTQQGEGYVISERTKKTDEDVMCMADGKYTTCDDHEHPHFYLALTKAKVKPGKYIATGPAYMVLADVPLPVVIPFGFFPFTSSYSSGVMMPTFDDNSVYGLGLRDGGYYFALSDYADLELLGDIYTNKTWAVRANTNYVKRYKFSGSFNFSYRNDKRGEKDLPDYTESTNMSIMWNHRQDSKASPYRTLSANVNFSTSGYNRSNVNNYNDPLLTSQNTKASSISYTQRFPNSPWSLSVNANMAQRTSDSTITLTLPSMNFNMSRIYPFKRKEAVGKEKWYEKIALSYTGELSNSITSKEKDLLKSSFVNDWRNGMRHNIPISASFTLFKYINISPTITLTDRMYFRRCEKSFDSIQNQITTNYENGFYNVFDFSTGLSASTKLYGFYIPARKLFGDKIDRIRHVITPSIGFNWTPDFGTDKWGYYNTLDYVTMNQQTGQMVHTTQTYSRYENSLYGTPGQGRNGSISFSLANNLEMKVRNDNDTTGKKPFKVISLIDNLSIGGGYNMMADSMNWQSFAVSLRIKLWKNYSLSLSTTLDPYMYGLNAAGNPVRINQLYWNHGKFPRWSGTAISVPALTIDNNKLKKWLGKSKDKESIPHQEDETGDMNDPNYRQNDTNQQEQSNAETIIDSDGYQKAEVPWSISVNYSLRYNVDMSRFDYQKMFYKMKLTNNLSVSGNIGFGKGWKVNTSASYDFDAKKLSQMTFNVTRNLHCWSMSGSFVPFGTYKYYSFRIGVNASMLADLKYDKRNDQSRQNLWW